MEFRQPLSSFKLVNNKQKTEWIIAFMRNISDVQTQRQAILEELGRVNLSSDLERLATSIA